MPCWQFISIYLLTKYKKKWFFLVGGTPLLAPKKVKPPKNDPPWLPITPIFYCRILFSYKNGGGCKKLDLNMLKIDWAIAILSLKIIVSNFFPNFDKFFSLRKIAITRGNLRVPSNFFSIWSLMSPFNYQLLKISSTTPKNNPN